MIIVSEEKKTIIENLTFLSHLITFISVALDMDIDISIYKNKIIDDLLFVTNTLPKIEEKIENSDLNEKEFITILSKMKNVKDSAIILMESIVSYKYKQAIIFEAHNNDIKSFMNLYKDSSAKIQKRLNRKLFSKDGDQVSREELYFLFGQEKSE
ncbi:MAG: hypothetical protein FWD87_06980 [Spirochaetaceae bacterium]|nr:hypothetical protein [Spirochaetaceae bacterium]